LGRIKRKRRFVQKKLTEEHSILGGKKKMEVGRGQRKRERNESHLFKGARQEIGGKKLKLTYRKLNSREKKDHKRGEDVREKWLAANERLKVDNCWDS